MKRGSIEIDGQTFSSKAALKRHVQAILRTTPTGAVRDSDLPFLLSLFQRHPSRAEKFGCGVRAVRVAMAAPYNTRCFQIERDDGTTTDISYLECLNPTGPADWFRAACRTAVVEQIQIAKDIAFISGAAICPITGEAVDRESCHADHAPPWTFDAIVNAFIADRSIAVEGVAFVDGDNATESRFANSDLAEAFSEFHKARAVIRIVSRRANLSLLRRGQ